MLLVDDERDFVDTLCERLRARGFDASAVYGGDEALAALRSDGPRVMVLDLKMPGTGGIEVLRRMRELATTTQVIVLTGHASSSEMEEALALGARECLRKPAPIELIERLIERIGRDADHCRKESA